MVIARIWVHSWQLIWALVLLRYPHGFWRKALFLFFFPTCRLRLVDLFSESEQSLSHWFVSGLSQLLLVLYKVQWMMDKRQSTNYTNCSQLNSAPVSVNSTPVSLKSRRDRAANLAKILAGKQKSRRPKSRRDPGGRSRRDPAKIPVLILQGMAFSNV